MMEYKKITEVEMIEEPSENATVLAEDDGKLRRVPFKTAPSKTHLFSWDSVLYFDEGCTEGVTGADVVRIMDEGVFDITDLSRDNIMTFPLLVVTSASGTVLSGATVDCYVGADGYATYTTTDYEAAGVPA